MFVTLALALLQGFSGDFARDILGQRLEEIVVGALIGVAAAWFVLPVRSTDVLRRRIAEALAALAEALDPATPSRGAACFVAALARVEKVTPPFRAARLIMRRTRHVPQADWADTLAACRAPAVALIARGEPAGTVRKAVGAARKALREPPTLGTALAALRRSLESRRLERIGGHRAP